jgi:hypothetical protein
MIIEVVLYMRNPTPPPTPKKGVVGKDNVDRIRIVYPQVADEGDGLQIWTIAANILNK